MLLIPHDTTDIRSPLTPEQISDRLRPFVGPRTLTEYFKKPRYQFGGSVQPAGFKIIRHTTGRNSYLPVITGSLEPMQHGTAVHLSFRLHWVIVLIMLAVFAAAFGVSKGWPIPLIMMLAFHVGMYLIGYLPEKKRAEALLLKILQPENLPGSTT